MSLMRRLALAGGRNSGGWDVVGGGPVSSFSASAGYAESGTMLTHDLTSKLPSQMYFIPTTTSSNNQANSACAWWDGTNIGATYSDVRAVVSYPTTNTSMCSLQTDGNRRAILLKYNSASGSYCRFAYNQTFKVILLYT